MVSHYLPDNVDTENLPGPGGELGQTFGGVMESDGFAPYPSHDGAATNRVSVSGFNPPFRSRSARREVASSFRRCYEVAAKDYRLRKTKKHPQRVFENYVWEALQGGLDVEKIGLRTLFAETVVDRRTGQPVGGQIVETWHPSNEGGKFMFFEDGGAVSTQNFSNIMGQIVYNTLLEQLKMHNMIADRISPVRETQFNGEKIAGVSGIGDVAEIVEEGAPFPRAGVAQEWLETPETLKRGFIVPVTKEAIFFDRTNMVLQRARDLTTWLAVNKEKRVIRNVLGLNGDTYRYRGDSMPPYGSAAGPRWFANIVYNNPLRDWRNMQQAQLMFDRIDDPMTGEPVDVMSRLQLIVPTVLIADAIRLTNAREVRHSTAGEGFYAGQTDPDDPRVTLSPNPIGRQMINGQVRQIEIVSSPYIEREYNPTLDWTPATAGWWLGDFARAFRYGQNWGAQTSTAPTNSQDEFERDITNQFKISERGVPETHEPYRVVQNDTAPAP